MIKSDKKFIEIILNICRLRRKIYILLMKS